jgi:hypothetical protein
VSGPNAELQAALTQFSTQPGVSADQAAQLRNSIVTNASLLTRLNQDAHAGHLSSFALQPPGGAANLVGTYDLQTGVITLPNGSFQASGTAPSADLKATLKLQDMSLRLGHSTYVDTANISQPVTKDMLDNLQNVMNGSPVLAQQMKDGVNANYLQEFAILDAKIGAGGTYNDKTNTMSLPATSLQMNTPTNQQGAFNAYDMTFVLGHEIQHGFNAAEKATAASAFKTQIANIAQSNNPIHDYTTPIGNYIEAGRKDEAKAELAGWNAVLSNLQVAKPTADRTDMYAVGQQFSRRMHDFVEKDAAGTVIAKSGLSFNNNNDMLPQTPGNIEAMGVHYFDKPPAANSPNLPPQQTTNIGFYRESDYANYYGANAISNVINHERALSHPVNGVAPHLHINMTQLHLEERLMERLGISIGTNPNTPQKYYDTSQNPPAVHHFDHTNTTGTPTSHQHVPVAPNAPANRVEDLNSLEKSQAPAAIQPGMKKPKPDGDETPDQGLPKKSAELSPKDSLGLETMLAAVRKDGRWDEEQSKNIAAAAMLGHASDSLQQRVDSVSINERGNVFSTYSPHGDKDPHFHSHINGHEAAKMPAEQSINQVAQVRQQQQQEAQVLAQQQTQKQNQDGPIQQQSGGSAMKGPSM